MSAMEEKRVASPFPPPFSSQDLKFAAKSITSQDFSFSFSLAGFSAALAKVRQ